MSITVGFTFETQKSEIEKLSRRAIMICSRGPTALGPSKSETYGDVAELADALDLGSSFFGSAGSTPVVPTFSGPSRTRASRF